MMEIAALANDVGLQFGDVPIGLVKMLVFPNFEGRSGSRHYSRWPDPWRREDDWGPITAAVMFFVILAGFIVYGSGAHL
jgi:hypothetical protein